jgi:riboflavin synthase
MFTGIVTEIGEVVGIRSLPAGLRLTVAATGEFAAAAVGASIAVSGPCLTVVERGRIGNRGFFDVDASTETLARTTIGEWTVGRNVNLERALKLGDELGGHVVTGHIDGVATVVERHDEGGMARFVVEAPTELSRYIAEKGSVSLDGTSLTVNRVDENCFDVMIIPHTLAVTTWGERRAGDRVNLEIDLLARYLERLHKAV